MAKRKGLHIDYYFIDPQFGLIHVMIQTWFPLRRQVFVNGHNWVANKLEDNGIGFTQCDNVFVRVDDIDRAQRFADRLAAVDWPAGATRLPRQIKPPEGIHKHHHLQHILDKDAQFLV